MTTQKYYKVNLWFKNEFINNNKLNELFKNAPFLKVNDKYLCATWSFARHYYYKNDEEIDEMLEYFKGFLANTPYYKWERNNEN
jgi:hypothetical protein